MISSIINDKEVKRKAEKFFGEYPQKVFKKGEMILTPGRTAPGIYYLRKGMVAQCTESSEGTHLILHLFRPGSFFYMPWLFSGNYKSDYFYQAQSLAEINLAPFSETWGFLEKNPDVLAQFTARLAMGVSGVLTRLAEMVFAPVSSRVPSLLVYFAKSIGEKKGREVMIPLSLTHREIAAWIGATRETVSIQMEDLARKGLLVKEQGKIILKDLARLEKEATS